MTAEERLEELKKVTTKLGYVLSPWDIDLIADLVKERLSLKLDRILTAVSCIVDGNVIDE